MWCFILLILNKYADNNNLLVMRRIILVIFLVISLPCQAMLQDLPDTLPDLQFHLTARPWEPLDISSEEYLNVLEGLCAVAVEFQNEEGAIIDPFLEREHQYSTPYFALGVAVLVHAGRADESLQLSGIKAMEHATRDFAKGSAGMPDTHGEFFIAPLTEALFLFENEADAETWNRWKKRLQTPIQEIIRPNAGSINNWRTYAMKGEWLRAKHNLTDKDQAVDFIEESWLNHTQRTRIGADKWNLYQDWSSDPQSHAVEGVGRGNLIGITTNNYDGPSSLEMEEFVDNGTHLSLLLQSADGQAPTNGRTDNHLFGEILFMLSFDVYAEKMMEQGREELAGQFRRAAMLAFNSMKRWIRKEHPWAGSLSITKNFFDHDKRVGFQPASQWGNYTGAAIMHIAEAYLSRQQDIEERPAPVEIGGYAFTTDHRFSTFFANAGGMQIQANLRGADVPKYNKSWSPLGVIRFSRVNWDSRLGPSDGEHDRQAGTPVTYSSGANETADNYRTGSGITFGPTWQERGQWVRIADLHKHYRGTPEVHFVHPLLVRFSITYSYITGRGGPYFIQEFTVTPDGVFTTLRSPQNDPFALTVPLLENDGRPLVTDIGNQILRTSYSDDGDEQTFLLLNKENIVSADDPSILSTYGYLKPVRVQSGSGKNSVFIYPRNSADPTAEDVLKSFQVYDNGFSSDLGSVNGLLYRGRTSAGGYGSGIDLDDDGSADITFSEACNFILQLSDENITAVEADKRVSVTVDNKQFTIEALSPYHLR